MDKSIILSVAGSGKTSYLINRLDSNHRFLIVTYTNNNVRNIRNRVYRKFGFIPRNVQIYNYFSFLINVCYRPFFASEFDEKGISWQPDCENFDETSEFYYVSKDRLLLYNRIAKKCFERCQDIAKRISMFFDYVFYDEVQDLAGHDFNFMLEMTRNLSKITFVGDFYQHTFCTSFDGTVNKSLYDNYDVYKLRWSLAGVVVDENLLSKSYRCPELVCQFIREKIGITIFPNNERTGKIEFVYDSEKVVSLVEEDNIPKLFYQNASKYNCFAMNWGESKGLDDFQDVCVVLNKNTFSFFKKDNLQNLNAMTKNKLYVACTRTKRNLYFIEETKIAGYKK